MMLPVSINIALILLGLAACPTGEQRSTAEDIAHRVQDRDTGRDSRVTLRMKLYDRHDRARARADADFPARRQAGHA